jgi:hypothetical protein
MALLTERISPRTLSRLSWGDEVLAGGLVSSEHILEELSTLAHCFIPLFLSCWFRRCPSFRGMVKD